VIRVEENAHDLLRKAASRLAVDLIMAGEYQPAEVQLSRRMLEVCLEVGFPVSTLSRSPLVLAPPPEKRLPAMEPIARAGTVAGTCMMPILLAPCYDAANLEVVVRWTAEHGGRFALSSGLTLAHQQRQCCFGVLRERFPDRQPLSERLYPAGSCGVVRSGDLQAIGRRMRELRRQYGIADPPDGGVPRPINPGDKRALLQQADR